MMWLKMLDGARVKRNTLRKRVLYHVDKAAASFPTGHITRGYTQ